MKYEDYERAQELRNEISRLQGVAAALKPDVYDEGEPVTIGRFRGELHTVPISIPAELASKLYAMVWKLVEEKEKEFKTL